MTPGCGKEHRYLPTNLTAPEIAAELHVSPNSLKTHSARTFCGSTPGRRRRGFAESS
ncbi:MAG: hypothetical protein ACRDN0_02340 [Trebonia sp.]